MKRTKKSVKMKWKWVKLKPDTHAMILPLTFKWGERRTFDEVIQDLAKNQKR